MFRIQDFEIFIIGVWDGKGKKGREKKERKGRKGREGREEPSCVWAVNRMYSVYIEYI